VILLSPAFALRKPSRAAYTALKWIVCLLPRAISTAIIEAAAGKVHNVNCAPHIIRDGREAAFSEVWTRTWPKKAGAHLIRLYLTIELGVAFEAITTPMLTFACPRDDVADFIVTERNLRKVQDLVFEEVAECSSVHVITGAICTPETVDEFTEKGMTFLRDRGIG